MLKNVEKQHEKLKKENDMLKNKLKMYEKTIKIEL
jgi:hypothetical protein